MAVPETDMVRRLEIFLSAAKPVRATITQVQRVSVVVIVVRRFIRDVRAAVLTMELSTPEGQRRTSHDSRWAGALRGVGSSDLVVTLHRHTFTTGNLVFLEKTLTVSSTPA